MKIDNGSDFFMKRIHKQNLLGTYYSSNYNSPNKQIQKIRHSLLNNRKKFPQKQEPNNLKLGNDYLKQQKTTKYNSTLSPKRNDAKIRYRLCTSKNVVVFSRAQNPSGPSPNKLNLFTYDNSSPAHHTNAKINLQKKSPRCIKQKQTQLSKTSTSFKMRKVSSSQSYRKKQIPSNYTIYQQFDPWISDENQQDSDILFYRKQIQ